VVRLRIENLSETRKVEYSGWGDASGFLDTHVPTLKDNFGNTYPRISFGFATRVEGQVPSASIHPGKSVEDVVVLEAPVARPSTCGWSCRPPPSGRRACSASRSRSR
jgi:hypothetical protein